MFHSLNTPLLKALSPVLFIMLESEVCIMARGVKTDNKTKAKIRASYALTNSYNATAKDLGISPNTVKAMI
jgi:hypothetical protein